MKEILSHRNGRLLSVISAVLVSFPAVCFPSTGQTLPRSTAAHIGTVAAYPPGLGPVRVLFKRITEPGDYTSYDRRQWGRWDLFLYDFPSGHTTRLTDRARANLYPFGNYYDPAALSPDGQRVAFGGVDYSDIRFTNVGLHLFTHIWTLDVGTRAMRWLSRPPSRSIQRRYSELVQVPGYFQHIVWSPDGRSVAADVDIGGGSLESPADIMAWYVWDAISSRWLYPPDKAYSEAAKRWGGERLGLRSRWWHGNWVASWDHSSTLHVKNTRTGASWTATWPKRWSQLFWTPDSRNVILAGLNAYASFRLSDGQPICSGKIKIDEFDVMRLSGNGRWLFAVSGLPDAPKLTLWDWQTGASQEWQGSVPPPQVWEGPVNAWLHTTVPELRVLDVLEMPTPTG